MTKKHKHKNTVHDLKVIAARHKNEVMEQMKYYFNLWSADKAFNLLPKKEVDWLYRARITPCRFEPVPGAIITKKELSVFREQFERFMNVFMADILPGLPPISLQHFISYFFAIIMYIGSVKTEEFSNAKILKELFRPLLDREQSIIDESLKKISMILDILSASFSDPSRLYYMLKLESFIGVKQNKANYFIIRISTVLPETAEFNLPEGRRTAFRLGIPFPDKQIKWIKARPPDTGTLKWQSELDIYIQSHAIKRVYERLDILNSESLLTDLFFSFFLKAEPIFENNFILFPFKAGNSTVGYFKGDIVDDKILLRTFLFLTNQGTPEARRLHENAGLCKMDISYLKIDTLRSFIDSDIIRSPALKKLFTDAGCSELFKLEFDQPGAYSGKIRLAQTIQKYLGLEDNPVPDNNP